MAADQQSGIDALRDRYRCIASDHRGQGRGAKGHRHCIGIELLAQEAAGLLDRLAAGPVHLAGLSMGGFVARRVAVRRPDHVRTLVLLEPSADPEPFENVPRHRLLTGVSRTLGPRPVRSRVAPIMLGKAILRDPTRRNDPNASSAS